MLKRFFLIPLYGSGKKKENKVVPFAPLLPPIPHSLPLGTPNPLPFPRLPPGKVIPKGREWGRGLSKGGSGSRPTRQLPFGAHFLLNF